MLFKIRILLSHRRVSQIKLLFRRIVDVGWDTRTEMHHQVNAWSISWFLLTLCYFSTMSARIFKNIALLAGTGRGNGFVRGKALADLPAIKNAYLVIEGDSIAEMGVMEDCPYEGEELNPGTIILPAWYDSHSHLVFAESREEEFVAKIKGKTYAEIAVAGGGILNSAKKLNETPEEELLSSAKKRLDELIQLGTGALEIKSGYGLTVEGELKMLRVIQRLKKISPIPLRATFLGAHAYPEVYRKNHQEYLRQIIEEMLPVIAQEGLADYMDVFCEEGFFSVEEMKEVCAAGKRYSLPAKLHVNQLSSMGGIEAGIAMNALSLDHLETLNEEEIKMLGRFDGAATLLPTAAFFLKMNLQPARELINAGAAVTLATDFNPGSSPSGNMNFVISLSCIGMGMLPEEAINAATINGACAMDLGEEYGSIDVGKKANLIFTKPISSLAYLPYAFGQNNIKRVMAAGKFIRNDD